MERQIYRLTLDLRQTNSQAEIRATVGDSGRSIVASLTDGSTPFLLDGGSAVFKALKPDGNRLYNSCTVDGDTVTYNFTEETVSCEGTTVCEFDLYDGSNKWIASPRFALTVENAAYPDSLVVQSSSEYNKLRDALNSVENLDITAERINTGTTGVKVTVTDKDGVEKTTLVRDGEKGDTGVGIIGIGYVKTEGLTKTYRIYLSDDSTQDFTVTNGAKGDKGDTGEKGDAGPQGEKGDKGETGAKGMGILSITLFKTEGKEKTYRIFMADSTSTKTYDYVVTDGADGSPGETGVSVTGAAVTDTGHLNITLSDGTTIDAGVLPVSSVNGKTGVIELSASDIGAPTDAEFDTVSVLSGLDSLFSTSASAMFGTSGMDINIGLSTQQPIYICLSASSGLSAGASITATPYWGGTSMQTTYAAIGMKLNRWYKIGHPMVGATVALPKINVKTDTGSMMTSSMNVFIRYTEVPGDTIDLTVAADAVACNAFVEKEVTSITTTNTPVVVSDAPSVSKAYIYLRYPGTPATPQIVTATPVYSGAEYSAGVVSNMKLNRWYALGVPADGAALSAVKLKVNTGTISSVTAVIRYDGNIDGNGVSY